ncbi:SDR family oxidoreductase [Desulfurispira natronophila]|uniref:Uncharacterized protein YbjT (DUF2867 family) n=1 Tax=Desulfurispira natronophila TaxID=682562 RepID=A0A7W7Y2B5_9BACT|nr:SDR family oxidoreductase [Desulfurispira natronophila]MBB5020786.1 uncharacterized protein YbjT (DUF2867 family) [Desulfurispira natronophila]
MRILLTGANGYIGRRLHQRLLSNHNGPLRLMVRNRTSVTSQSVQNCEVVESDVLKPETLPDALENVDIAYYLVHSLAAGKDFKRLDREAAENFRDAAIRAGVKRIIYLGGLGDPENASEHLVSRIETGEILSRYPQQIETIWFRAGVIIGSGSSSFEIVRHLVQKLPVMVTPRWVNTKAQPIAVDDVVRYLLEAKDLSTTENQVIDIGSDVMSYGQMMLRTAEVMGLRRYILPVPLLTTTLSSYWLAIFTPVPYSVARSLIEGLGSEVVVRNNHARQLFPFTPMSFDQAVQQAVAEIENDQVLSRWSDAFGFSWEVNPAESLADAVFVDRRVRKLPSQTSCSDVFNSFTTVGGDNGWFRYSWLWGLRGLIDKLLGGFGLNRGRRQMCDLRVGDCLDFWKVVHLEENRRMLLEAQMKVPGKAWLEFVVDDNQLVQSAYFYPNGLWGRIYWYLMIPAHHFVFNDLANQVVLRAARVKQATSP